MNPTLCLFSAGAISSKFLKNKSALFLGGVLSSSILFYTGSMSEFINLSSGQKLSKKKPGYWMINGGVVSAGLSCGALVSIINKKMS